ncbi:MAG: hypothetical protein U0002_18855 [Thermoanaerobaculia bacterium]
MIPNSRRTFQTLFQPLAVVAALAAGTLAAATIRAQEACEGCQFRERGDRSEGVWKAASMISGGSFELMSVRYRQPAERGVPGAQMHLSFWLPEAAALDELLVWKPLPSVTHDKVAYRMQPKQRQFAAGRVQFAWPRGEVLDRLEIPPGALYARIKLGESYLPALLAQGEATAPAGGYTFVFDSGAGIDARCTVARLQAGAAPAPVKSFECYQELGGAVTIEWDGRDQQGRPAPAGLYVLGIEGDMLAEVLRPLEATIRFWHRDRFE